MSAMLSVKYYNAMRLHFNTPYNAIRYNFKTRLRIIPEEQFRIHKKLFGKYKFEIGQFYLANFLENKKLFIHELPSEETHDIFIFRKNYQESLTYNFRMEMMNILTENAFNDIFKITKDYPVLMKHTMYKEISPDTFLILDLLFNFMESWKKKFLGDMIFDEFCFRLDKYRWFTKYDKLNFKEVLTQIVMSK